MSSLTPTAGWGGATAHDAALLSQYCTFWADGLYFGIAVDDVQEVMRAQDMTVVPLSHSSVQGLLNLRGEIVTAIDLRHRLGLRPWQLADDAEERMNVVVRSRGEVVSLLVDDIGEVLDTSHRSVESAPSTVPAAVRDVLDGVIALPDRLLLVLDAARAADVTAQPHVEGTP